MYDYIINHTLDLIFNIILNYHNSQYMPLKIKIVCFALICLLMYQTNDSFCLTPESQKILKEYQDYKESGYAPIPSKKPVTPTKSPQSSQPSNLPPQQSQNTNNTGINSNSQPWIIGLVLLVILIGGIAAITKGGGSRPWGSHHNPPSMKQLWRLREEGYRGPMPTSSRDAHNRINDIEDGGDGNYERDDDEDYDDGRNRY